MTQESIMIEDKVMIEKSKVEHLIETVKFLTIQNENQRLALIQLAGSCNWSTEEIKNIVGATDEELQYFI